MPYALAPLAALALYAPELAPAPLAAALASPIGEIATVLALTLAAAEIAGRYLWPVRNR